MVKSFRDVNQDGCPFNKGHLTWQYAKALMCKAVSVLGVLPKGDDEVGGARVEIIMYNYVGSDGII